MKNIYYNVIFRLLHVTLLSFVFIESFGCFFGIQNAGIWHCVLVVLGIGLIAVINYGNTRERLSCSIVLLVSFLLMTLFFGVREIGQFIDSYACWIIGKSGWIQDWVHGYELLQTVIIIACCYLFQMAAEKQPILRDILAVALLVGMIIFMLRHNEISHLGVVLILGYIAVCYIELTQHTWKKKKVRDTKEYVLWIAPFCALYIVFMLFMPVYDKPYDWKFIKDAYKNFKEEFTVWIEAQNRSGKDEFGTASVGFSENGRLMSGIFYDNQKLLTIQGSQGLRTNIYLVGKVYDTFDGKQWTQTITEDTRERKIDTLETIYAIERYEGDLNDNYIYSTGLTIRYEYFDTSCVFAPLKLRYIEGCDYLTSGANLYFEEQKGYGTDYRAAYFQLNVDHPKFYEMAETKLEDSEELWNKTVDKYAGKMDKRVTLEDLMHYRNEILKDYHQDIILSAETDNYISEVTKGYDTNIQKLRAIEKELSTYTYTMSPGKIPDIVDSQEDFLDYFLLESKKGYCSYFATAFVLLARAEGMPARYVQGFCVPVTVDKKMTVTSDMAHAWPEVYIEGVGWIPFEPTPGYEELRYMPWEIREEKDYHQYVMDEEEEAETIQTPTITDAPQIISEKDDNIVNMAILGIVTTCVSCIAVMILEQKMYRKKYMKMLVEEKFLVEVRKNLWLLSKLGYIRKETETLEEFQSRIINELSQL